MTKFQQGTPLPREHEGQAWGGREAHGGLPAGLLPRGSVAGATAVSEKDAAGKSDTWICHLVYFRFFLKVNVMGNQSERRGGDGRQKHGNPSDQ